MKKLTQEEAGSIKGLFDSAEIKALFDSITKSAESETGTFSVVISTENLDRYDEVVKLDGWDLEHFKNNPVVLWMHDHKTLPIGMATSVEVKDGKLIAHGRFASHPLAQDIRKLYDDGILNATSVGFIEKDREGNIITKAELIEFSFVTVPANPFALRLSMEKGVSVNEMVTKGFFYVEKDAAPDEEKPAEEVPPETPAPVEEQPPVEEKTFSVKAVVPVIAQLKELTLALEALVNEEPEREEAPVSETEEERTFREFSEKRRIIQLAATYVGDVLAEARRRKEEEISA